MTATDPCSPLDVPALRDRVGDDLQLLAELAELFFEEEPELLAAISAAIEARDPERLRRAGHTMKGAVANFCAPAAKALAEALEEAGRSGEFTAASVALPRLVDELSRVRTALRGLTA